jgi:type VI protein secretion system component Hcp
VALCLAAAASLVAVCGAAPATAGAASSIGPLSLYKGTSSVPAVQIPATSLLSFSFQVGHGSGASSKGWGGGAYEPKSASELTITKMSDSATKPLITKALLAGTHFKVAALTFKQNVAADPLGQERTYCLSDVFIDTYEVGTVAGGYGAAQETIGLAYSSFKLVTGSGGSQPCAGESPPPVTTSLLGLRRGGSSLLARVDCLSPHCRGILTVDLPRAACEPGGKQLCSFTGGVRVGINGSGKVHFTGSGTATLNGGTRVGIGGSGNFAMGEGGVKILRLAVPSPLRKWLTGNRHATLGAIIVVHGSPTAIVEHDVLGAPAKLPAGAPSETLETTPGGGGPTDLPQSLTVTGCTAPLPANPVVVVVNGSLAPARGGAKVTLTYTPVTGPPPLPSPVVDAVTTDAAGNFSENFDREQGGKPYSWNVVASIPEGDGYAAAQSPACAIPIP